MIVNDRENVINPGKLNLVRVTGKFELTEFEFDNWLKLDKNSPSIPVDSITQQVERRTGTPKVRVQIPLESAFIS